MINFATEYLANHKLYRLLKLVSEGNLDAIEILYRDYSNFIYWHIMDYTDDKDTGEDILQEVFIKLYSLDSKNLPRKGATSWLIRVIHNTAITYLTRNMVKTELCYNAIDETCSISIPSPEESIISKEYVSSLIKDLDRETQQILLLRNQGFSFLEISEKLNINHSTVRSKYSRAIKKLAPLVGDK